MGKSNAAKSRVPGGVRKKVSVLAFWIADFPAFWFQGLRNMQ